jgi:hypothetical protein
MIAAAMGWIGTIGSISAYLLLTRGRWQATSLRYSALNGAAGVLAGSASAVYGAWPSVTSNLLWSLIAAQAAYGELRRRRELRPSAVVTALPSVQHDPEPPTGPQSVLVAA